MSTLSPAPASRAFGASRAIRRFFSEAVGVDPIEDPRTRRLLFGTAALFSLLFFVLSLRRYQTFHNHTFDLAFYARMAWGEAHFDVWQPILSTSVYGLHLVWIFEVLGWVGEVFGQVPTLLLTQALALGGVAIPLGRIATRHLGPSLSLAGPLAALLFYLHPNTAHVAVGDFHPGTVAALPIAWMMDALDRRSSEGLVLSSALVLACREDLGLLTALGSLLFAWRSTGNRRRVGLGVAGFSLLYVGFFVLVMLPRFGPEAGSLALHFGSRGASTTEVVLHFLTHPSALVTHLATPERLLYLPTLLAPLSFLPLLAPELLIATPLLAIALLSEFPTATHLDSHYLTPALPILVSAALLGAERAAARLRLLMDGAFVAPLLIAAVAAHVAGGGTPLGAGFDRRAYVEDANTAPARRIVAAVPEDASIQAPDPMLAHFAERADVRRPPPPEGRTDFVVFDVSHRRRLWHDEDLLRTEEEPLVRAWLARDDHALVELGGDYVLLARDRDPRSGIGFLRFVTPGGDPSEGRALTACVRLVSARLDVDADAGESVVELMLVAAGPCPSDLGLRIGVGYRPQRVDLIADGAVSPAHLRAGDRVRSRHPMSERELEAVRREGLRVGALRESGSPPEHGDPPALDVSLDP